MAKKAQVGQRDSNVVGEHADCGGNIKWVKVSPQTGNARMAKMCQKCGKEAV